MSTKNQVIAVRLPPDLLAMLDATIARTNTSASEIMREALHRLLYADGSSQVSGLDDGYAQARRDATRIAFAAMTAGLAAIPEDRDDAMAWVEQHEKKRRG